MWSSKKEPLFNFRDTPDFDNKPSTVYIRSNSSLKDLAEITISPDILGTNCHVAVDSIMYMVR